MAPTELIERTVEYSNLARKEGILALEAKLKEVKDPFFAKGLQCVVDGFSADTVRSIMELDADWSRARHANGKKVLETFAAMAPAFGMIGTLVGLVQMLASLSDPSQIGGGMAVALLTTFYGAVIANVMCIPIAGKLDLRAKEEAQLKAMMIDGVLAIQSGEKPTIIRERLSAFLAPKLRERAAA
jgi:chemotaxis protein MotA